MIWRSILNKPFLTKISSPEIFSLNFFSSYFPIDICTYSKSIGEITCYISLTVFEIRGMTTSRPKNFFFPKNQYEFPFLRCHTKIQVFITSLHNYRKSIISLNFGFSLIIFRFFILTPIFYFSYILWSILNIPFATIFSVPPPPF